MHKVLLIDDSKIVHSMVREICAQEEFMLIHARGLEQANDTLEKEAISLILLDAVLKDIDGFEYCRQLKSSKHKNIPIIFLTGRTEAKHIIKGLNSGASDYIPKPFEKEIFLVRIYSMLRLVDMQEQLLSSEKLKSINTIIATYNHEFNNPLQIALMSSQNIKKYLPEDAKPHADKLYNSLDRVMKIVEKIKNLTSVETGSYGQSAETIKIDD